MIETIDGKLYFEDNSKHRIYLRGRTNLAVNCSLDGKSYNLGATITKLYEKNEQFQTNNQNTYFNVEYLINGYAKVTSYQGSEQTQTYQLCRDNNGDIRNWLYVKEVLIDHSQKMANYIGLGFKQWTVTTFTMITTYLDINANELSSRMLNSLMTHTAVYLT